MGEEYSGAEAQRTEKEIDLRIVVKGGRERPRGEAGWGRAVIVCRVGHVYV